MYDEHEGWTDRSCYSRSVYGHFPDNCAEGSRWQTERAVLYREAWAMKGVHQVLLGPACQPLEGCHLVP